MEQVCKGRLCCQHSNAKKLHVNCDGSLHILSLYKLKRLYGNVKMFKKKMKRRAIQKQQNFLFSATGQIKKICIFINRGMYIIPKCEGHSLYICPLLPECLIYKLIIIISCHYLI